MRIRKHAGFLVVVTIFVFITGVAAFRRADRQDSKPSKRPALDKTLWPISDYNGPPDADPERAARRKAKGKKFDKSEFRVHPDDRSQNTTLVDAVDRTLLAFPIRQSTTILVGRVLDSHAYLSDDQTGVYSEFTINVDAVLKNDAADLTVGSSVALDRPGGRVRFQSGQTHWYSVDKENMPGSGRRYVFFLKKQSIDDGLRIITAYEIRDGKVSPLDDLPQFLAYDGKDEAEFMSALRDAILNP